MNPAVVETVRVLAMQQCLFSGSCDARWIADQIDVHPETQYEIHPKTVGQHLARLEHQGILRLIPTPHADLRLYRFTVIGAIEATTPEELHEAKEGRR